MPEINPVLLKELRQRFRQGKTFWLLSLYLLILGGFVLAVIYLNWRSGSAYYRPGHSQEIFMVLSFAQLALIAFVVPGLTAGAISGERERQTLNVLLTTPLTNWGIIWSKLISSTAFMVLLVITTLPLFSIVFIYGGIAPGQLAAIFGFYLLTMFLFASMGIACSSIFKRTGISTITSYGLVLGLSGGLGFLTLFLHEFARIEQMINLVGPTLINWVIEFLQEINPIFVLFRILTDDSINTGVSMGIPYWAFYMCFCITTGLLLLFWSKRKLLSGRRS